MSLEPFLHFKHKKYAFGGQNQPYGRIYQSIKDWAGDLAQALEILEILMYFFIAMAHYVFVDTNRRWHG